jgi:SHS2 domain-containing protein
LVPTDDSASPGEGLGRSAPSFEILEHPADIGFRAFGGTVAELFENAALALISIGGEIEDVAACEEHHLEATATDYESLLVAWLSEVLYWFDGKRIIFWRCSSSRRFITPKRRWLSVFTEIRSSY